MLVEGDVEIKTKDRAAEALDEHDFKLWLQRAFKNMCCYRISALKREPERVVRATVALKIDDLPPDERALIEARPQDAPLLRQFIERMWAGKGQLRALGEPKLRKS